MLYLESFKFPTWEAEDNSLCHYYDPRSNPNIHKEDYYHKDISGNYPFGVLSSHNCYSLDFEPITILYGGNGSGKSTALNVMANVLKMKRHAPYNTSVMMDRYCGLCKYTISYEFKDEMPLSGLQEVSQIITSDDIFKGFLDRRERNKLKIAKATILNDIIPEVKYNTARPRSLNFETGENVDEFMQIQSWKKKSFSRIMTEELGTLEEGYSNGENSLRHLMSALEKEGLYLLDEPENSMSCSFQKSLAEIIHLSAMRCNTQFIIATHSPFLLAMPDTKIYNLDADPVVPAPWYELDNMRQYFELFDSFSEQFKAGRKM